MKRMIALLMGCFVLFACLMGCNNATHTLQDEDPVNLTIWHYYVSTLQTVFEDMVTQFNNTVGKEKGILVTAVQVPNIDVLTEKIIAASEGQMGADPLPDLIFAYTSTVLDLHQLGLIADIGTYFSEEELSQYLPFYIEEGRIGVDNVLMSFPVAKSSEVVFVENVKYSAFKEAVNASDEYANVNDDMLKTFEGIMQIADVYYQWTDDQTPEIPNDGKAFFGVDATPNYISVGARQLSGIAPITTHPDGTSEFALKKETAKKLWEYYFTGIVTGRFAEIGWYRADDMKMGDLISYLGSTGGATYFPLEIALEGQEVYQTELLVSEFPVFEGAPKVTIQQGAGMSIVKTEEKRQQAAAEFLKWFTEPEQNVAYSFTSGYSPVKKAEYTQAMVNQKLSEMATTDDVMSQNIAKTLELAFEQMNDYELTVDKEFQGSYDIRNMLGISLSERAQEGRAQFLNAIAGGAAYEEALTQVITEEAFENWYEQIQSEYTALSNSAQ